MSLDAFFVWLAGTSGSIALKESIYVWPLVEATHVWTLAVFVGMTFILDLRLVGAILGSVPVSQVSGRLVRWAVAGFVVMVITGGLLFYANPVKTYHNIFFRAKLIMLVLSGINVLVFQTGIYRRVAEWDLGAVPRRAKMAGIMSLVLWVGIVLAGRLTAYYWFDCDTSERNPPIVNVLQGCSAQPQVEGE